MQLTLGTALAVFAGVVLLALALHGWWSQRRTPQRTLMDSVLPGDRVEPAMGGAVEGDTDATREGDPLGLSAALRVPQRRVARLDALIDAIVPLALEAPITGEMAMQHLPPTRRAGSKPFYIEGLDSESAEWDMLQPGRRYGELQAGVQLASRSGALNEIEYSEFVQKVEAFALAIGATPRTQDMPDMLEVVARARELDGMASPLDAQLSVTLRSNGAAWSVAYVQQVAARLNFVAGPVPGRLVLPSTEDNAPPMLVLAVDAQAALAALGDDQQASGVHDCVLTLDVPQTPATAEPFPAWHRAATQLAEDLDAVAIDNDGQPITLHAYAAIGQDLEMLYQQLEGLDLAAGSAAARRLFS